MTVPAEGPHVAVAQLPGPGAVPGTPVAYSQHQTLVGGELLSAEIDVIHPQG